MTGKSSIIGNKSELHPSITPFFGGCFFISLLFHFQNGNVFGKLKEATMPVCQCPTTSGSANLRRKVVSMIRILNKSKKLFSVVNFVNSYFLLPALIFMKICGINLVPMLSIVMIQEVRISCFSGQLQTQNLRDTSKKQTQ